MKKSSVDMKISCRIEIVDVSSFSELKKHYNILLSLSTQEWFFCFLLIQWQSNIPRQATKIWCSIFEGCFFVYYLKKSVQEFFYRRVLKKLRDSHIRY